MRKPSIKKLNKIVTDSKFDSESLLLGNIDILTPDYCRIKVMEILRSPVVPSSKMLMQLIALQEYLADDKS